MTSYNAHITFLDDVWGLCASNIDAFCNVERTKRVPTQANGRFVLDRYHVLVEQENRDPSTLLEELVEMGPSVATLFEMTVYLDLSSNTTVAVPRRKSKLQRMNRDTKNKTSPVAGNATEEEANHNVTAFVTANQRVLEMCVFALWYHGLTKDQLNTINFVNPSLVSIPLQPHNEIIMLSNVLNNLLATNCHYLAMLADPRMEEAERQTLTHPTFSTPQLNIKPILRHICFRIDPYDGRFWRNDSAILTIMLQMFHLCYAMAADFDETYQFSNGKLVVPLDLLLVNCLNSTGVANPEYLRGLARHLIRRKTPRILMRGRLVTAYDLLAMVPAAQMQVSNADDEAASEIVDARRRARMMQYCLKKSPPNSNYLDDDGTYWKARVLTASLLVFVGGVLSSMQANSRIF